MQNDQYPAGFSENYHVQLEESEQNWRIGDVHVPGEEGMVVQTAAFDTEQNALYTVQLKDMDYETGSYQGLNVIRFDAAGPEGTPLDDLSEIPRDVRGGMYDALASMLEHGSTSLDTAPTEKLLGAEAVLDMNVAAISAGFDPTTLLNDGLSNEELEESQAFAARLDSREGDAEIMNLSVDEAEQRLALAKKNEPKNTPLHREKRLEHDKRIDEAEMVEPDGPDGHDTERYSDKELRSAAQKAEASENAAIARAKSWGQAITDKRDQDQGEDKGRS